MFSILITELNNSFTDGWDKIINDKLFNYQIKRHKIINAIINIFLIILCSFLLFSIKNIFLSIPICVLIYFLFFILFRLIDVLIVNHYYPYKENKRKKDINKLNAYLEQLQKKSIKINHLIEIEKDEDKLEYLTQEKEKFKNAIKTTEDQILNTEKELKEKVEQMKKESILNNNDKKNIKFLKESIQTLSENEIPEEYQSDINEVIKLSNELLTYIKENPVIFKSISKIYNVYLSELCNIFSNMKILEKNEQEEIDNNLKDIIKNLILNIKKTIEDAKESQKNDLILSVKILEKELSESLSLESSSKIKEDE